ncbi:MAG: TIGR02594 family protein [Novosphingobium sp.]|nr:TIGR02594 family protein [Novosphingobium sp.]
MTVFSHDAFMAEWRSVRSPDGSKITQREYDLVMAAISGKWEPASPATQRIELPWIAEARRLIGQREIPGPRHNSWIAKGWARLGAGWFNDDETPWCGFFVAHCLDAAGQPYPGKGAFARAREWASWGKASPPRYGCIAVFGRQGGGHVGFAVGESASNLYILGGNQSNAVNIMPIAKSRLLATRWPAGLPLSTVPLPPMNGGVISRNEA